MNYLQPLFFIMQWLVLVLFGLCYLCITLDLRVFASTIYSNDYESLLENYKKYNQKIRQKNQNNNLMKIDEIPYTELSGIGGNNH